MAVNVITTSLSDEDLLVAFANTGHDGPDELADHAGFRAWYAGIGSPASTSVDEDADLVLLREVRQVVRDLALRNNGVAVEVHPTALAAVPLRFVLDGGPTVRALGPTTPARDLTGLVAAALVRAGARADWRRVKACPGPDCAWVFRDRTRNASRRWCQMQECGNRAKGAAFRARSRALRRP